MCVCVSVGMDAPRAVGNAGARGRGFARGLRLTACRRVCLGPGGWSRSLEAAAAEKADKEAV